MHLASVCVTRELQEYAMWRARDLVNNVRLVHQEKHGFVGGYASQASPQVVMPLPHVVDAGNPERSTA
jgi:hypothetical protein